MAVSPDALTILLVEDNPADARLVRELLADASPRSALVHVSRLAAAVERLDGGRVDVIVLDLGLPDAGGLDAVARLRTVAPDVPIVILSGNDDEALALEGVRAGAQDYLLKGQVEGDRLARALLYAVERKRWEETLRRQALSDPLTGLPNRLLLHERAERALLLARRTGARVAVLFLDLDGFKQVNDSWGHEAGDRLLQQVARRLVERTRASDTVARLGGDEFVVLLPSIASPEQAAVVAAKILESLNEPWAIDGRALAIGVSIGVGLFPADGQDVERLIGAADRAMYRAKRSGKNRCVCAADPPPASSAAADVA